MPEKIKIKKPAKNLCQEELRMFKYKLNLALRIQKEHPEIKSLRESGFTYERIEREKNIAQVYNTSRDVAIGAIGYAITGFDSEFDAGPFSGMIPERETRDKISKNNQSNHAKELMKKHRKEKRGTFGFSSEKRRKLGIIGGKKGGLKGGKTTRDRKIGIHNMTAQERVVVLNKAIYSKGLTPWTPRMDYFNWIDGEFVHTSTRLSELEFAVLLAKSPQYQHTKGPQRYRLNCKLIEECLNNNYHSGEKIRNGTLRKALMRYRKSLNKKHLPILDN